MENNNRKESQKIRISCRRSRKSRSKRNSYNNFFFWIWEDETQTKTIYSLVPDEISIDNSDVKPMKVLMVHLIWNKQMVWTAYQTHTQTMNPCVLYVSSLNKPTTFTCSANGTFEDSYTHSHQSALTFIRFAWILELNLFA